MHFRHYKRGFGLPSSGVGIDVPRNHLVVSAGEGASGNVFYSVLESSGAEEKFTRRVRRRVASCRSPRWEVKIGRGSVVPEAGMTRGGRVN